MKLSFKEGFFIVFSLFWVGILFIDYWDKHPIYWLSLTHYKYWGWTAILGLIGVAFGFSQTEKFKIPKFPINGLVVFGAFLFTIILTAFCFNQYLQADLDLGNYWHLIERSSYTLICSYIVLLSAYSAGDLIISRTTQMAKIGGNTSFLVKTGTGFLVLVMSLFAMGSVSILTQIPVLILLLAFPLINYKRTISYSKNFFWNKFEFPSSWNFWGYLVAFITLIYSSINFLYTQSPFPLGFDARNYYVNIAQLLADQGSLVKGFQPYAWSLMESVGYIAFFSPEVTMFLATIGGFMSFWGIYELGVRYLKLDANYVLLAVFLFLSTPAINNHWIIEYKVDLALLFVQISILCLTFYWLTEKKSDLKTESLIADRFDWQIVIVLGLLMGFALSIKVLSIFLTFGLFVGLWWYNYNRIGAFFIAFFGFGFLIMAHVDDISGLRVYHIKPHQEAIMILLASISILLISMLQEGNKIKENLVATAILVFLSILPFVPWGMKNYKEITGGSLQQIVTGTNPQLEMSIFQFNDNYKASKKAANEK